MFVRISGDTYYLWRAVDQEGEVLEVFATKRRDRRAALTPRSLVTDRLRSYRAAIKTLGIIDRQECGQWLNHRAETSHQPFRRREGAMARFRDIKTLQTFASVQAAIYNHFNIDRDIPLATAIGQCDPARRQIPAFRPAYF